MVRFLFSLSVFLLLFLNGCSPKGLDKDSATNDSIKKYLDLADNNALNSKTRIMYNDKALALLDLSENDTLTRFYLYCISSKYSSFMQNEKLKATAEKLSDLSLKSKDSIYIAKADRNLGLYYMNIANNDEAMKLLCKAEHIF